jgi:hypothetical protein
MRALQGAVGDRGGADVEDGDHSRPGTSWAVGGRARVSPRASAAPTELPFADEARDFVADAPAPEDFGA